MQVYSPFNSCGVVAHPPEEVIVYADWVTDAGMFGPLCQDSVLLAWTCNWGISDLSFLDELGPPGNGVAREQVNSWGGTGSEGGQFLWPQGIVVDASNYVYVVDSKNHRVQKWTSSGTFLLAWGSEGSGDEELLQPSKIAVGPDETIYVADALNSRIQRFTNEGQSLGGWGSLGFGTGEFWLPMGVATDDSGFVYVSDWSLDRVQKFTSDGTWLATWDETGVNSIEFFDPTDVAADAEGNVYVLDRFSVKQITSSGVLLKEYETLCGYDSPLRPTAMTVDSNGFIYIAQDGLILKFNTDGCLLTGWGALGAMGIAMSSTAELCFTTSRSPPDEVRVWQVRANATAVQAPPQATPGLRLFPNPFSRHVSIEYDVRQGGTVEVAIFDVQGRRVRTFTPRESGRGTQTIKWDGRASDGTLVATGIYFARLKSADYSVAKKLVFIK